MIYFIFLLLAPSFLHAEELCLDDHHTTHPLSQNPINQIINTVNNSSFNPCAPDTSVIIPRSQRDLCKMTPQDFQALLCTQEGRMGFSNQGGLFGLNTGLCWWHSEFHRQATYLAYYSPQRPKPNYQTAEGKKELRRIFNDIISKRKFVEIPGYSNLQEFTEDPYVKSMLIKRLQQWMAVDGLLKFQWAKALEGSPRANETSQLNELNQIFHEVNHQKRISYMMIQQPGLPAHAAIIFDIKKIITNGEESYELKVQDSNFQHSHADWIKKDYSTYIYKNGEWKYKSNSYLGYSGGGNFSIFRQRENHFNRFNEIYRDHCRSIKFPND